MMDDVGVVRGDHAHNIIMSPVKTPWRTAACLMFLTGPFRYTKQPQKLTKPLAISHAPFLQYKSSEQNGEQPQLLFVKRHSKSGFMPDTHVFPGGVLDEADSSPSWLRLFSEPSGCDHPFSSIASLKSPLPMYSGSSFPTDSPVMGEVAFRICAIREFFEEAGILLARDRGGMASVVDIVPGTCSPAVKVLPRVEMEEWRVKVHNDANQFIVMCRELGCVPDIWSLIEWSDWLTPRNYKRRYDTLFFICYSETRPEATPDMAEVTGTKWLAPTVASELFQSGKIKFAPPQFAEIKYLESIGNVPLMHQFALHKSTQEGGVVRKRSVRIATKDSIVSVGETDDLFPMEGPEDWTTPIQHPQSSELQRRGISLVLSQNVSHEFEIPTHTALELREMSSTTNRMEFYSRSKLNFISSVNAAKFEEFLAHFELASKL